MDCRDLSRMIDAYWDRELPADQSARVQAHLGQCPACHAGYGRVDDWLSAPAPVLVPAGLRDRVLNAVVREHAAPAETQRTGPAPARVIPFKPAPEKVAQTPSPAPRHFISLGWVGALAACIVMLVASRSQIPSGAGRMASHSSSGSTLLTDSSAVPGLLFAAIQPSQLSLVGAAAAQAAAMEQASQARAELPLPLRMDRRPLREDYIPSSSPQAVQQLPAVFSAISPLGA